MPRWAVIAVMVVAIVVLVSCGYIGSTYINGNHSMAADFQAGIRDQIMASIAANHPETAPLFKVTNWSGGLIPNQEGFEGSSIYQYTSVGWNLTIQYPVVPDPIYSVNATYADPNSHSGNVIVDWQGT